jgi:hypothetical protein
MMKRLIFVLIITCVAIFLTQPVWADLFKKMCWTDKESDKIYRANLDNNVENIDANSLWPEFKLTASDGNVWDLFGGAVDIDGDHCVVRAPYDEDYGAFSGSAYIFEWDGTNWFQQAKLTEPDANSMHYFCIDASIDGDRCAVGTYYEIGVSPGSGWAYIFESNSSAWIQAAKLKASDSTVWDAFGRSVSIKGNRCIVGAPSGDSSEIASGAAYIFEWDGSVWIEQAKLTASDAAGGDGFGSSVDIRDDRCIIGAPFSDGDFPAEGSAYIFKWDGSAWIQDSKLKASDPGWGDCLGRSVSISGNHCVVGAEEDDDKGVNSGSAYIFEWNGTDWIQQAKFTLSDGEPADSFGCSVGINDDLCIIGAYNHYDTNFSCGGSAYIFEWDGSDWIEHAKLGITNPYAGGRFGYSVGISDGRYIVGAPDDLSAYVFQPFRLPDLDKNWIVDFNDFAIFALQWLQAPGVPSADIAPPSGDGFVDYYDLAVFANNWLWK